MGPSLHFGQLSTWDKFWSHRALRVFTPAAGIAIFLACGGIHIIARLLHEAHSFLEILECIVLGIWYGFSSHRAAHGAYFLLNGISLALANRRLLGRRFREHRRVMRELTEVSHLGIFLRTFRLWKIQVIVATVLLFAVLLDYHLLFVTFYAVVLYAWGWVRTSVPPAVLLLAQSDVPDATQLQWDLRGAVDPRRVVSFLGHYRPDGKHLPPSRIELDCLRSANPDDWWDCVTDAMQMAPAIVIDGRARSSALVREAEFIAQGSLVAKTLFIALPDGRCPLLDQLDEDDREKTIAVERRRAVRAIRVAFDQTVDPQRKWPRLEGPTLARIVAGV